MTTSGATTTLLLLTMAMVGSASAPLTPSVLKVGPSARTMTFFNWLPLITNPAISTSSPVPTIPRVEMLVALASGAIWPLSSRFASLARLWIVVPLGTAIVFPDKSSSEAALRALFFVVTIRWPVRENGTMSII